LYCRRKTLGSGAGEARPVLSLSKGRNDEKGLFAAEANKRRIKRSSAVDRDAARRCFGFLRNRDFEYTVVADRSDRTRVFAFVAMAET
jgi:hypothetical protein